VCVVQKQMFVGKPVSSVCCSGGFLGSGHMKLKEITASLSLTGVEPTQVVSVVATVPLGDLQLIYSTPDGNMNERLLSSRA